MRCQGVRQNGVGIWRPGMRMYCWLFHMPPVPYCSILFHISESILYYCFSSMFLFWHTFVLLYVPMFSNVCIFVKGATWKMLSLIPRSLNADTTWWETQRSTILHVATLIFFLYQQYGQSIFHSTLCCVLDCICKEYIFFTDIIFYY